ncbi:MAG: 5'/3'-nucleotidase SurE [Candidatus Dormibacteraceae bacterium]
MSEPIGSDSAGARAGSPIQEGRAEVVRSSRLRAGSRPRRLGPRPRILLTNDDGIASPGLLAAYAQLQRLGEVTVVAPDVERSAVGHAITTLTPLRVKAFSRGRRPMGYSVSGMPADCVKIAIGSLLAEPPDLVVSGINLGPNAASNVIYSGTVSAATEARMLGIPSMAISLGTFKDPKWNVAAQLTRRIATAILEHGLPRKVVLNVNVPNLRLDKIKGVKVTRMGTSGYIHDFTLGTDPDNQAFYSVTATYKVTDTDQDTDAAALEAGWVTITPLTFDHTAYDVLDDIAGWSLRL